ncbi:TIR domain-containing protein [Rhodococcus sp. 14-2470-1a]|uniref:TIR domain-containing protein n=1 Tax=Rhodococcus sp. 14-2470-1a TaxID=2023150 RepID=UPI000B9AE4AC|nr:TIR domain-containing protein [Rhodococcus sp. 14-2470-1a]OZF42111.1 hypothetical protein CH292_26840 [Rhodococcus sp. 14-2470-1a]
MSEFAGYIDELESIAEELTALTAYIEEPKRKRDLNRLNETVHAAHEAWSKSNLGYHAFVYYHGIQAPPPGVIFSKEWGLSESSGWEIRSESDVRATILTECGDVDVAALGDMSDAARKTILGKKEALMSILATVLAAGPDPYLDKLSTTIQDVSAPSADAFTRQYIPRGQHMSRDMQAMQQGLMVAPHQRLSAELQAIEAPYICAATLSDKAKAASEHLGRRGSISSPMLVTTQPGTRIFIGHGQSPQWRELKEFLQDRLGLEADEFNRVPVAGTSTTSRLSQMLDGAAFACLIMTAEDERADGSKTARANVIHEVGLFQGRLGFEKAIVLLEEGCEEFSNITGLSQLRYPANRISAIFENLRQVLEREGLL